MSRRAYGLTLVTIASVLWSTAGLFVRLLDLDLWTMLAWRCLFAALSLCVVVAVQSGWRLRSTIGAMGWPGLAAVPISAVSMICYVASLKLTSVANVLTVYATVPFIAAGLAYVWLGEAVKPRVLWASGVALLGVLVMVGSGTRLQDLAGNGLAFAMTVTFSIVLVMARRFPALDMAPVNAAAAALCAIVCASLAPALVLPAPGQLVILALFGATTTALAYLLFLTGGRFVPSGEAGLVGLLDVILGPLWVWLAFSERPSRAALVGGGLVLAAVLWYLSGEVLRRAETA